MSLFDETKEQTLEYGTSLTINGKLVRIAGPLEFVHRADGSYVVKVPLDSRNTLVNKTATEIEEFGNPFPKNLYSNASIIEERHDFRAVLREKEGVDFYQRRDSFAEAMEIKKDNLEEVASWLGATTIRITPSKGASEITFTLESEEIRILTGMVIAKLGEGQIFTYSKEYFDEMYEEAE